MTNEIVKLTKSSVRICKIAACVCLVLWVLIMFSNSLNPILAQNKKVEKDEFLANKAADTFLKRYRESLDLETARNKMAVSEPIPELRNSNFLGEFGISTKLLSEIDDRTLDQTYIEALNTFFIGTIYNVFYSNKNDSKSLYPEAVMALFKKYKVGKFMLERNNNASSITENPFINTKEDLHEFIKLEKEVALALKKRLPPDLFNSSTYKDKLQRNNVVGRNVEITNGEDFGLGENISVYEVRRDFINIFFIKKNGSMKILHIGLIE